MQSIYDNDLETLLEQSIDQNYLEQQIENGKKCPLKHNFDSKNRNFTKVDEKSKFNHRLLPAGWLRLVHESGIHFYCHVPTKVVTWSMPYEILTEPARYHRVPIRSIPCLSIMTHSRDDGVVKDNLNVDGGVVDAVVDKSRNENVVQDDVTLRQYVHANGDINDVTTEPDKDVVGDITMESDDCKEDGEIESEDEKTVADVKNRTTMAEERLPRRYQQASHRREKASLSASVKEDDDQGRCQSTPAVKRQRLSSDAAVTENDDQQVEQLDPLSRLLEPHELRLYCQKIFSFVDDNERPTKFLLNSHRKKWNSQTKKQPPQPQPQPQHAAPNDVAVPPYCTFKVKIPNKNILLEVAGRNYSCILSMYCQHAFGVTPIFKAASTVLGCSDFETVCEINGSVYGTGEGRTKKAAKQKATLKTLEILIPGFLSQVSMGESTELGSETPASTTASTSSSTQCSAPANSAPDDIHSLFDTMDITDPRVYSYSTRLSAVAPYNLLTECLNRHCISDTEIKCKIEKQDHHNVFQMTVGDKEVETRCENKREGRQLAAQFMLAKLHPHIRSWGGMLRLYGPGSKPAKRPDTMQEVQGLLLEDRGGVKNNLIGLLRRKMLDLSREYESATDKSKAKFRTSFQNIPVIVFHPDSAKPTNNSQ